MYTDNSLAILSHTSKWTEIDYQINSENLKKKKKKKRKKKEREKRNEKDRSCQLDRFFHIRFFFRFLIVS